MKRALVVVMLAALAATPVRADTWLRFGGSVFTATPDAPGEAPLRPARCAHLLGVSNEIFAFFIELPADAPGRAFRVIDGNMSAVDGLIDEPANFDIAFYDTLATCEAVPAPEPVRFRERGDEAGIVPDGARFAFITLTNKVHAAVDFLLRVDP